MEQLKHECGIAMIRLRKPLEHYLQKYGSYAWGLNKLYLLMEKQHNRGQEAAGVGVVNLNSAPGHEYVYRERALGTGAIDEIFATIGRKMSPEINARSPFVGQIYMGHLRYSTTGRSGIEYAHPFLRRNNWRSRALMLCGNFNMTNVDEIFNRIIATGQHPRIYSDTVMILEQLGNALDKENHRIYRNYRDTLHDPDLARQIELEVDFANVLAQTAPTWDGGYTMVGTNGSGSSFVMRDPNGIRPAFYYIDDEIIVAASERPVIQTVFNLTAEDVQELTPGSALIINSKANPSIRQILPEGQNQRCSFERVYFSRGSDRDIYRERKKLGANIVPQLMQMIHNDFAHTVFSFIPNTAEVAFLGMVEELNHTLDRRRKDEILQLQAGGEFSDAKLHDILRRKVRVEKVAIKDIKLRTFIAEGNARNDLAAHVYDITYGSIVPGQDTLVVLDDSIVRGTTLKQSILRILDRLSPKRIIVVSSSPQVRYPDYYGIDMPRLAELSAFQAAVNLLLSSGRQHILHSVYEQCLASTANGACPSHNAIKAIYQPFTQQDIAAEMARMLRPQSINASVDILFQTLQGLDNAIPTCPGTWYFSGNYPTPGGLRLLHLAFIDFYKNFFAKDLVM